MCLAEKLPLKLLPQRGFISYVCGCLLTSSVMAAESQTILSEEDFLAEIPIALTATRLAQPLTEAPAAITILDRETIQASGAREIAELFRLIPGFLVSHDDGHSPIVTYHGLADEHVMRLQVLVDGRSVYSPVYGKVWWTDLPLAIDDIEHIEVIRGPNTVTYGSNSFLSVINIVTRHASETTGSFVRVTRGTDGIDDEYARFGDTTGDVDYRVTVGSHGDDGFENRVDSRHMKLLRGRLDYQASAKDTLMAQLGATKGKRALDSRSLQTNDEKNVNDHFVQLRWQRQISATDALSVQTFYTKEDANQQVNAILPNPLSPGSNMRIFRDSSTESERYDFELQHTKQVSEPLRFVWGVGARQDSAEGPQIFGVEPDPVYTGYPGNRDKFTTNSIAPLPTWSGG
jgi:iron complex outermembrane receptor protein